MVWKYLLFSCLVFGSVKAINLDLSLLGEDLNEVDKFVEDIKEDPLGKDEKVPLESLDEDNWDLDVWFKDYLMDNNKISLNVSKQTENKTDQNVTEKEPVQNKTVEEVQENDNVTKEVNETMKPVSDEDDNNVMKELDYQTMYDNYVHTIDNIDDYQFEDNRLDVKEQFSVSDNMPNDFDYDERSAEQISEPVYEEFNQNSNDYQNNYSEESNVRDDPAHSINSEFEEQVQSANMERRKKEDSESPENDLITSASIKENVEKTKDSTEVDLDDVKELFETWKQIVYNSSSDEVSNEKEILNKEASQETMLYKDDALVTALLNSVNEILTEATTVKETEYENITPTPSFIATTDTTETLTQVKFTDVQNITVQEYDQLIEQFKQLHGIELDTESESFTRNVAAVRIQLKVDEPTVVTSPNYPDPYPTNNIVDWIFDGEGRGIEMNITDFAVNGALGDYLLVKPGGLDESGSEGLIFTYTLNSPRRYRFLDVDRMFVRFKSNLGFAFSRGFKMSVRMIFPPHTDEDIDDPESEALLPEPAEQFTVTVGGLTLPQFKEIEEQFRILIANMATLYINSNGIDMGINTTAEVTQITSSVMCNINWPGFESCVSVRFAVPLVNATGATGRLTTEDLRTMWGTYVYQDPFATMLRRMGITDFTEPATQHVLTVWLVIGTGVLIAVALLAFAMWRFSCLEGYTRMTTFSDSDSIQQEKRYLDLYPTPHQSLPPLYAEPDFKWDHPDFDDSPREDMNGFTNRSFVRDELLDLDLDLDQNISSGDRKARPKDYNV